MREYDNSTLAQVLLDALQREYERIQRANEEIAHLREQLAEIGWTNPLEGQNAKGN